MKHRVTITVYVDAEDVEDAEMKVRHMGSAELFDEAVWTFRGFPFEIRETES